MDVQTSCPACGAPISIPDRAQRATCPFCKTSFIVDLSGVEPRFKVAGEEDALLVAPQPPAGDLPPFTVDSGAYPQTPDEPVDIPPFQSSTIRSVWLSGRRLWIAIAVAVLGVGCSSCLCLVFLVKNLFR